MNFFYNMHTSEKQKKQLKYLDEYFRKVRLGFGSGLGLCLG